jgi:hypothetical protein
MIEADVRKCGQPTDRAHVDDMPHSALSHPWQHRLQHGDNAMHVGIELRADVGILAFLDGSDIAIAGVVDEYVDVTEPVISGLHCGTYLLGPGDIQGGGDSAVAVTRNKIAQRIGLARRNHGTIAPFKNLFGQCSPQAGRAACYQPHGIVADHAISVSYNHGAVSTRLDRKKG